MSYRSFRLSSEILNPSSDIGIKQSTNLRVNSLDVQRNFDSSLDRGARDLQLSSALLYIEEQVVEIE